MIGVPPVGVRASARNRANDDASRVPRQEADYVSLVRSRSPLGRIPFGSGEPSSRHSITATALAHAHQLGQD
jgi:hypothetical protein